MKGIEINNYKKEENMKLIKKLNQNGNDYKVVIDIDSTNGNIVECNTQYVEREEKESTTFSVLLNDDTKAKYSVKLDSGKASVERIHKAAKEESIWKKFVMPKDIRLLEEIADSCFSLIDSFNESCVKITEKDMNEKIKTELIEDKRTELDTNITRLTNLASDAINRKQESKSAINGFNFDYFKNYISDLLQKADKSGFYN